MKVTDYPIEDLARVTFWASVDFHAGQWSEGYKAQCIMSEIYRPGACELGIDWENPIQVDIWAWFAESDKQQTDLLQVAKWIKEEIDYQMAYHAETGL